MEQNDQAKDQLKYPEKVNFLPIIHDFFENVKSSEQAFLFLKKFTKCKIYDYTVISTRKIFYALVAYKFGSELGYPEQLTQKARQLIMYVLQNKEENYNTRRKIFKEYLVEFDNYKEEDFKNYMYELGVQYHQLEEMIHRLSDHPEWLESIKNLQEKVMEQVNVVRGHTVFQECLDTLSSLKQDIVKQNLENAYWDMMVSDLSENNLDCLMNNYTEMKNTLLEMGDDQDTKEILDEEYIKQLLENGLFESKTLSTQIHFIYHKLKTYGIPIYDKLLDKTKNELLTELEQNGLSNELIVTVMKKTLPIVKNYIEVIRIYRNQIKKIKEEKEIAKKGKEQGKELGKENEEKS
jgi:hypothetical protein